LERSYRRKIHDDGFYSDTTIIGIYVFLCMYKILCFGRTAGRRNGSWCPVWTSTDKGPRSLFKERNGPLLP
jgi:hypothetical protein